MTCCENGIEDLGCIYSCDLVQIGINASANGVYTLVLMPDLIQVVSQTVTSGQPIVFSGGYLNEDGRSIFKVKKPDGTYLTSGTKDCFQVDIRPTTNATLANVDIDVTCSTASAILKNSANTTISTTSIASGATANITAPDATAVLKNSAGTVIDTEAIPSNVSEDITIPNVAWTDSDGSAESTPYGNAIVCTVIKTLELYFAFEAGDDTSALATNGGTTWTLTAISDDGASGAITVSDNGGAYGAFVNPTTIANAETIQVKRVTTTGAGWVLITGTYA